MKVREVIRMLESDGWYQVRLTGSHRQFKHDAKIGLVTVPGKPKYDLETGKLGNWETGKLGNWETGKLGNWAAP